MGVIMCIHDGLGAVLGEFMTVDTAVIVRKPDKKSYAWGT